MYLKRRQRLLKRMREQKVPALFISNPLHVHYLTGFTGDSSFILITPKRLIILSDERYRLQLQDECPKDELAIRGADRNTYQLAAEVINKLELKSISVEAKHLTRYLYDYLHDLLGHAEIRPSVGLIEELRAIKDDFEVQQIRTAVDQAQRAFGMFKAMLQPELSEKQMVIDLETYLRRAGANGPAFPVIAEVGEHSAYPHATVSDRKLGSEPFMLLDWGALNAFYQSDLTRIIRSPFADRTGKGHRSVERVESDVRKLYTILNKARTSALEKMKPGTPVKQIDGAVREVLSKHGVNELFNHGLGHGIGLETHEAPQIRSNSEEVLQIGMIVTLEPGLYQPGLGGVRIEDDILITEDGPKLLSNLPHEWDELLLS
jgi:Xaa-Pro aminopeptidase